jgi:protein O-GlcNAc transferase
MTLQPQSGGQIRGIFEKQVAEKEIGRRAEVESQIRNLKALLRGATVEMSAYLDLASCYAAIRNHGSALETLRLGVGRFPGAVDIHYALLRMLHKSGLDDEALEVGKRACKSVPDDFSLQLWHSLYLPKLYESEHEIDFYHRRFSEGLDRCILECKLDSKEDALKAARGFSRFAPFYLAYQACDDLPLIRRYGEFAHRVMAAAYPQWARQCAPPPLRSKPRVGFVSAYFRRHTVGEHFLGWLTQRDPDAYEAFLYYLGDSDDIVTAEYRRSSDRFLSFGDLEETCGSISKDQLDILVFTDVGMHSMASQIAALRLAPVQCVTYGHPITTGLPTLDYFLSSELMEPPNAQENYTETLVQLPNLGIFYSNPVFPRLLVTKTRSEFGLPENAVLYLCCQSLFKYLPQHDNLLAQIALEIPTARFVFVAKNELLGNKLLQRFERSFAQVDIQASEFCYFLPYQGTLDYWNLHLLCDVFLDPPGWSGGRSTLDAMVCGLPIVTLPGRYARHRQAQAILKLFGAGETIAQDSQSYVAIATRLARQSRTGNARTGTNRSSLFADETTVRALESFIRHPLRSKRS